MEKLLSQEEISALFSAMSREDAPNLCNQKAREAGQMLASSGADSNEEKPRGLNRSSNSAASNIDLLLDIELPISVSLGHSGMPLKDILKLKAGSVIELDKSIDDPVTVSINHQPIAKGQMVTIDGNYGVRILEVEGKISRVRSLG